MTPPITLTEYKTTAFPQADIPNEIGELLWRRYGQQVAVEFPSPKTGYQWQLTPQGWVGHIPLTPEFHFALQPKVALANLFRMLEYAYRLNFEVLAGLVECQSLAEFYERLAHILARRVLDRSRKGLYRAYLPQSERLTTVRGRLNLRQLARSPGRVDLPCHYQEHTADVDENRILAWTLRHITRSGACTERVLPTVRQAYRSLQGFVSLHPASPADCVDRLYHRLNDDYRLLHALCRFFLEQSGPGHRLGERTMLPFLVNMARLFELFVAEWLSAHLPAGFKLAASERVHLSDTHAPHFEIDLVLNDLQTGLTRCVLDTKYKQPDTPSTADISQVITYAQLKGCREAILIYPEPLPHPLDEKIGDIRVRSLSFSLGGDLEQAGQVFLRGLLETN